MNIVGKLISDELKKNGLMKSFAADSIGVSAGTFSVYLRKGFPLIAIKALLHDFPQLDKKKILTAVKNSSDQQQALPLQVTKEAVNK